LFPKQTIAFVLIDTKEMILDLTILIIDDDCGEREMLQEAIIERMPDAKCLNASNGLEGLHLLLETKEDPQLIFLDLNMSKMNGFEYMANKNEKEGYNKIPIVVYTTSKQMRDKEGSFKLGATYFLIKPTCSKLLKSELQEIFKKVVL
jgi:CheY-like chemotaxis protein